MISKNEFWIKFLKANQKTMNFIYKNKYLTDISQLARSSYFRQVNRELIADLYRFYRTDHLANG